MNRQAIHFAQHLLAGDTSAAANMIDDLHRSGHSNLFLYEHLITAAMRYIGDLWEQNEITVADEHLASAVCEFVLAQHTFALRTQRTQTARKAMLFCLADEHHQIGVNVISALFAEYGWDVRLLGANLPLEYALDAARKWKPHVIGMSVATLHSLAFLQEYLTALRKLEHQPTILVGGHLALIGDLSSYAAHNTIILQNLSEVVTWLNEQHIGVNTSAI